MSDISCYILKSFPFSADGIKEKQALAGATIDIPGRLFEGLNREGYLRRAVIGDGHITLNPTVVVAEEIHETTQDNVTAAAALMSGEKAPNEVHEEVGLAPITPAPQPPVKTSKLSDEEQASIDDGSWRALKFFAKRSIAAKLSDEPIRDGKDADAAIELYIESKGAL